MSDDVNKLADSNSQNCASGGGEGGEDGKNSNSSHCLPTEIEMMRPNLLLSNPPTESAATMDVAPDRADWNIEMELDRPDEAAKRTRLTSAAGESETSSACQDATIFAHLTDESARQDGVDRCSPMTTEATSSDEKSELASTSPRMNLGVSDRRQGVEPEALIGLQQKLEHNEEALHRLIARASESEGQQTGNFSDDSVEKREQMLQDERARLRKVLSELGQMSQEMRELNRQLQDAEDKFGNKINVSTQDDTTPISDSQIAELRQELADERQRLIRALAELEDRNSEIERYRQELDALTQRQESETGVIRLQEQLDSEKQSASSLTSELNLKIGLNEELQEQLRSLLESRKTDHEYIKTLKQRLTDKTQHLIEMQQGLSKKDDHIGELQEQLRSLSETRRCEIEHHSKQIKILNTQIDDATEQVSKLNETRQFNIDQHSETTETMQAQLKDAAEKIASLTESKQFDADQFHQQIERMEAQLKDAGQQIASLTKSKQLDTDQYQQQIETLKAQLKDAVEQTEQIASLTASKQPDAQQLETMKDRLKDATEEISSLTESKQLDADQYQQQIERMKAELKDSAEQIASLTESKQCDAQQIHTMKAELKDAAEQIASLTDSKQLDAEQYNQHLETIQAQLKESVEEARVLSAAHMQEQKNRQMLENQAKTRERDLINEIDKKSSEILEFSKEFKDIIDEHRTAKDRMQGDLESELKACGVEIDFLRAENLSLTDKIDQETVQRIAVEKQLQAEKLSTSDLTKELNASAIQVAELSKQLSSVMQLKATEIDCRKAAEEQLEAERCKLAEAMTKLKKFNETAESLSAQVDRQKSVEPRVTAETHTQTSFVGTAADVEQNPAADTAHQLKTLLLHLEEKSCQIRSLKSQVELMNSEKLNILQAFESIAKELKDKRLEVEVLLAKVDNLKARSAYCCHQVYARQANADQLNASLRRIRGPFRPACSSAFLPDVPGDNSPLLDAATRHTIERRITYLEATSEQLGQPSRLTQLLGSSNSGQVSIGESHDNGRQ
uniref:GRIP domain-containing protein n=1 Tax=Macrostomum lignano TaxID=282301 RepID=A0A1I8HLQ0_9PLAT